MSVESVLARIAQIQGSFPAPRPRTVPSAGFDAALASALSSANAPTSTGGTTETGSRIVQAARLELGQAEAPIGSNDSPRIAEYRTSTEWAPVGPWCAYFASWTAKQAGAPLGERGQGFARVADVWSWGQSSGRALAPTAPPAPGDLAIMNHHMGVVEAVLPDGRIQTIEGNKDDQVTRTVRDRSELLGFVRPG